MLFRSIDTALKRPSPGSIPLSGPRASDNDFYSVHLLDSAGKERVWLKENTASGYNALVRDANDSGESKTLTKKHIESFKYSLKIEHYYKGYQFSYHGTIRFLLARLFCRHLWIIFHSRYSQKRFNRQPLIRAERIDLLKFLVESAIQNPNEKFDPLFLGMQLYSTKWFYHPEQHEHKEHLKLLLESFVESLDLERDNGNYALSGKALQTLSNHDLEQQNHQDSISTAKVGNRLTWAIVIIGLMGIFSEIVMWSLK